MGEEHYFDGITDEDRKQVWGMFADNDQQVRTMSGRGSNWLLEKVVMPSHEYWIIVKG